MHLSMLIEIVSQEGITHSGELRRLQRRRILGEMGGKCVECGMPDIRCLQIDHVHGGGNQHRKTANTETKRYTAVRANPGAYQLLCANCNAIKRDKMGEARGPLKYLNQRRD